MPDEPAILTINAGSSSIKFAAFTPDLRRVVSGNVERIGTPQAKLTSKDDGGRPEEQAFHAPDHAAAATELIAWLGDRRFTAVAHRVVHGGLKLIDHQRITPAVLADLRDAQPLDLAHLPREIALVEAFQKAMPHAGQFACFDSAFHRDLPPVAKLLPIPRKHLDAGVRRLGFHGLSYAYLMDELRRTAGDKLADGRVILAHLGSGASLAAVHRGKPIDTTMAFTPTAGIVMATRPGDFDPGLLVYLAKVEGKSLDAMDDFVNADCGLKGVSGGVSDMRDLLARRPTDPHAADAADAVDLFCYSARKAIGSFVAALGGLDALVFAAGIGEHVPEVRAKIVEGLGCFGIELDADRNGRSDAVISQDASRVQVRVIATDEEGMMARIVKALVQSER